MADVENLVIVGSGPAGLTAAIYAARANLKPLLIGGTEFGGQLMITTDVENYPGFPNGILGPELMDVWRKQAERFGTRVVEKNVTKVDFKRGPFKLWTDDGEHVARCVIIATGASAKWLGLPNETRLRGHGVSACATCDGFFFKDKEVVVVGGGDTAMEESNFLTKFAKRVTVVHRRESLRASKIMQERATNNPKIAWRWNAEVADVLGEKSVDGVVLKSTETGRTERFPCQGLFLAIGHDPNTGFLKGHLAMDDKGYLAVKDVTRASVDGVFAAGDVSDHRYRQAVTAAGAGCMAAMDAEKWLEEQRA